MMLFTPKQQPRLALAVFAQEKVIEISGAF